MSEYWVSKKKYFCKYCDIYIADDAPSRLQHENGLRHKGNVERFIRGLYKGSEKRKKDQDEEKRDMTRVELAAQAAYAQDVASGRAKTMSAPLASTSSVPQKPPPKPSNPFVNYTTAASLGYTDPDAERFAAETERRRSQGLAGDWEVVTPSSDTPTIASEPITADTLKRGAELVVDEEDVREFKIRKKKLNVGLGDEIYDPGIIPIKLKKKEATPPPEVDTTPSDQTDARKWTPVQWRRAFEVATEEDGVSVEPGIKVEEPAVKTEEGLTAAADIPTSSANAALPSATKDPAPDILAVKPEEGDISAALTADSSSSMFRKRKPRPNGNKGRAS